MDLKTLERNFRAAAFRLSTPAMSGLPGDHGHEVAFAGRSNAGKSSALNALTGQVGLARVSKTPGRTRLLNFFEIGAARRIVDLPGYGFAAAPEVERRTWAPMIEGLRQRQSLKGLILIVDSRRGVAPEDENLIAWAHEGGREGSDPMRVLLSKADKLTRNEANKVLKEARSALGESATAQLFSAQDKQGIDEAQRVLRDWLDIRAKTSRA
jgi:GTP-binding protein